MERRSGFTNNLKYVDIIVFAQSGFSSKCCPRAESHVVVVFLDLQDRGGLRLLRLLDRGGFLYLLIINLS